MTVIFHTSNDSAHIGQEVQKRVVSLCKCHLNMQLFNEQISIQMREANEIDCCGLEENITLIGDRS